MRAIRRHNEYQQAFITLHFYVDLLVGSLPFKLLSLLLCLTPTFWHLYKLQLLLLILSHWVIAIWPGPRFR